MPSKVYRSFSVSTAELCLDSTRDAKSQQVMQNPVYSIYTGHPGIEIKSVSGWKLQTEMAIFFCIYCHSIFIYF